jgi:hypothetical protein
MLKNKALARFKPGLQIHSYVRRRSSIAIIRTDSL